MGVYVYSEEEKEKLFVKKTPVHYVMLVVLLLATIGVVVGLVFIARTSRESPPTPTSEFTESTISTTTTQTTADPLEVKLKLLQEELDGAPSVMLEFFTNWAYTVNVSRILSSSPRNTTEVARLVKAAKSQGLKIRCAGNSLSQTNLFPDEAQLLIRSTQLRTRDNGSPLELFVLGNGSHVVKLAAGLFQSDFIQFMVENGVQIPVLGTAQQITMVGAISTGTHQANITKGSIGSYVVGVKLLDGEGDVREYNAEDHPQELATLRTCLGMCGVITEITFKVEPIQAVSESHDWIPIHQTVGNVSYLMEATQAGSVQVFWAPLSSLTYNQWTTYQEDNKMPSTYDPWQDLSWVRRMVTTNGINATAFCQSEIDSGGRRRRSTDQYVATLAGELLLTSVERQKLHNKVKRQADETNMDGRPLLDQWNRYNMTRGWFEWTMDKCLPVTIGYVDLAYQERIWEVEFYFPEDEDFNVTIEVTKVLFEGLRKGVVATPPVLPVTVFDYRWIAASPNCLLCPENVDGVHHISTIGVVADHSKNGFIPYIIEAYLKLKADHPSMRLHWGKFYEYLPDISDFLKESYGEKLEEFHSLRNILDKDDLFTSQFLKQIFS